MARFLSWLVPLFALPVVCLADSGIRPAKLQCEYLANPLGIDVAAPRLSWVCEALAAGQRGQRQTAYQVLVASSRDRLNRDEGDLWDSGRVESEQSAHVPYAGKTLGSWQACFWKVRVWDRDGQASEWSRASHWTMGILKADEWQAKWIGYTKKHDLQTDWAQEASSPVFRKVFDVRKPVARAALSICGLGYYELHLNGGRVGDHVLDPGFTRYDRRALYVTYDVTDRMKQGANAVGVMLGNGWYNHHTLAVWNFHEAPWRDQPKLLLNLRLEYADGSVETIVSDESWKANIGPVVLDSIHNGEYYDARREMPGWDKPGFNDTAWDSPQVVSAPGGALRAQMMPPCRVTQSLRPQRLAEPKPGVFIFDMGQAFAGWAELTVSGPAGTTVSMRFGERLRADGTLDQEEIAKFVKQGPFQTDTYILKGQGTEVWEPRFTYHGFRYVEVTGLPATPSLDTLRGRVVHTDFTRAGRFECSHELVNRIQSITDWSYRSNFHGYPTDCPHREKNGWTGDAHLAAEQAMYNWHNDAAYVKWLNDLQDEQQDDGNLPGIVPTSGWGYSWGNGPAWDSAYVLIPWYLYQYRGDTRVLADHFDRLKRYVDYMTSRSQGHLVEHGLGDWVPAETKTPVVVTSSGYYYADALLVARMARLLGKAEDAKKYGELAEKIRNAFNESLYEGNGLYSNGSQTALSCTLYQGLVPAEERAEVVAKLAAAVKAKQDHLDVGILGAKYLFHSLSANGEHDLAWRVATQTTAPSYGDWINRGATTLWEDWPGVGSLIHVMFGDISAWFYQNLGGINVDPEKPGFKHVIIRPRPVDGLEWVRAEHDSIYGPVRSHWRRESGAMIFEVAVPVNASATLYLPARNREAVQEGGRSVDQAAGVQFLGMEGTVAVYSLESGEYQFTTR